MSKLIKQNSLINFLLSSEFNIENNSHSLDSSLRNKVCEVILSKCSKA